MKVVVFGATGTIGRPLVAELAQEHEVTAVSRHEQPDEADVTWARADATDAESVARVLDGADAAYYLVHSLGATDFEERDLQAAETTARAAERAGVKQLVYLGGLGDDSPDLSAHLRSRRETGRRLASTSVPVTTLRAAIVIGRDSAAFETIVSLVDRLPAMITPRWVSTRTQPIALDDVVAYLAGVCGCEEALGQELDAGGPEVMTYREMMERIAVLRGKRPFIVEVPVLTPYLSSLWLHVVTPVKAGIARPLIEGPAQRDGRPRRPDPRARAARADAVRRRRPRGAGRALGERAAAGLAAEDRRDQPAGGHHDRHERQRPGRRAGRVVQVAEDVRPGDRGRLADALHHAEGGRAQPRRERLGRCTGRPRPRRRG